MPSAYDLLGLTRDATDAEIARRYRELAKATHPDAGGDRFVFEELTRAYELISTPERRAAHDEAMNRTMPTSATDQPTNTPEAESRGSRWGWVLILIGLPLDLLQYLAIPFVALWALTGSMIWAALLTPPISFAVARATAAIVRSYRNIG